MTDSSRDQRIGFIGTGNIGNPMARQLIRGGHQLVVFDLRPEVMENLLELGAESADSAAEVASRSSVVFTSLPGPPQIEAATDWLLKESSPEPLPGDIHVDLSTNSLRGVQRIVGLETDAGVVHIDAPVTGGVVRAGQGELTVYGSGDPETFERVRPLLDHIGSNVFHLGDAGMGCLYKLVNNSIVLSGHMIVQEALVLGAKAGLDVPDLVEKLRLGTARPYMGLVDHFLARQWENPPSTMVIAEKDVRLALELARDQQVAMPVANAVHQTYLTALAAGFDELHHYSTIDILAAAAGTSRFQRYLPRSPSQGELPKAEGVPPNRAQSPRIHRMLLHRRQRRPRRHPQHRYQHIASLLRCDHIIKLIAPTRVDRRVPLPHFRRPLIAQTLGLSRIFTLHLANPVAVDQQRRSLPSPIPPDSAVGQASRMSRGAYELPIAAGPNPYALRNWIVYRGTVRFWCAMIGRA